MDKFVINSSIIVDKFQMKFKMACIRGTFASYLYLLCILYIGQVYLRKSLKYRVYLVKGPEV